MQISQKNWKIKLKLIEYGKQTKYFKKINSIEEDELSYELTSFIKYVASQKEIDFTCTDIVLKANIPMSPKRFGRLLNNCIELLESEGVHITKCRTSDNRFYHATFEEPSLNETE